MIGIWYVMIDLWFCVIWFEVLWMGLVGWLRCFINLWMVRIVFLWVLINKCFLWELGIILIFELNVFVICFVVFLIGMCCSEMVLKVFLDCCWVMMSLVVVIRIMVEMVMIFGFEKILLVSCNLGIVSFW